MSKHTLSLSEFAEWEGAVKGVEIQSHLPFDQYVPTDDITVDVGRIATAARLGRLESVSFKAFRKQDSHTPSIVGVGEDGSAFAGLSTSSKAARRTKSSSTVTGRTFFAATAGTVEVNFGHEDLNDINLRDPKPWAEFLDTSIRTGITSSSNKRLVHHAGLRALLGAIYLSPVLTAVLAGENGADTIREYGEAIGYYAAVSLLFGREAEITAAPGIMLDRIGLQQAYSNTFSFVKATGQKIPAS